MGFKLDAHHRGGNQESELADGRTTLVEHGDLPPRLPPQGRLDPPDPVAEDLDEPAPHVDTPPVGD